MPTVFHLLPVVTGISNEKNTTSHLFPAYHFMKPIAHLPLKVDSHYHALSVHARNVSVQPKYYYMDFTSAIHTIRHVPYRARACTARSGFGFSERIFCRTVLCMNVNERAWTGIVNYLPTR